MTETKSPIAGERTHEVLAKLPFSTVMAAVQIKHDATENALLVLIKERDAALADLQRREETERNATKIANALDGKVKAMRAACWVVIPERAEFPEDDVNLMCFRCEAGKVVGHDSDCPFA